MYKSKNKRLYFALILRFIIFTGILFYKSGIDLPAAMADFGENKLLALTVVLAIYFIKGIVMFIPIQALYLAVPVIFGSFYMGVAVNILGIIICLTPPYFAGRILDTGRLDRFMARHPRLAVVKNFENHNPFFFSYIIRVVGFVPCDVVSVYCGIRNIPYVPYISGSVAGMLPGLLLTSIMGANIKDPSSPRFIIALIFQIFTIILSIYLYNKFKSRQNF